VNNIRRFIVLFEEKLCSDKVAGTNPEERELDPFLAVQICTEETTTIKMMEMISPSDISLSNS
jgi:hypothetical protein